jgi:CDP-paratose 2-epimerase
VRPAHWVGRTFNVGDGREGSLSLVEATALCGELTGNDVAVTRSLKAGLVLCRCTCPIARRYAHTNWRPRRGPRVVMADTLRWIEDHDDALALLLP